jgi:hypothetical protein
VDRIERSKQKYAELFGNTDASASGTAPDFADILNHENDKGTIQEHVANGD